MKKLFLIASVFAVGSFLSAAAAPPDSVQCSPDNGGIKLPKDFCAVVVADSLGMSRHITVNDNGDVYVALSDANHGGGIAALRDTNGDGKADIIKYFGDDTGTGINLQHGYLYFAPDTGVLRYKMKQGELVPTSTPQTVVKDLPVQHQHSSKTIAFDDKGWLYVDIGAPSNACQKQDRTPHSPGMLPCPLLKRHGGVWRFQADKLNQAQSEGERFITGMRNGVALDWNPVDKQLYVVMHGRDQLHDLWPEQYSIAQSAELPAEQFFQLEKGDNLGWPFCYYNWMTHKKVINPEYQGREDKVGPCSKYEQPIMAFPGHWAPDALLFYTGKQFPKKYYGGAFIAFHGSWNRAPKVQQGYKIVFVPFANGKPVGKYSNFAVGFKGREKLDSPENARFRPVGLAQGPDGSLYIVDSHQGRVWRVLYRGDR
ncbi:MAG TPA: PQQ-dependent sugar dehydrogenase [Gammaproteobacteria bacterium]|nr:PQQ-dependent sugar dehydrogenase [Gammaproteobacteria bacterium]